MKIFIFIGLVGLMACSGTNEAVSQTPSDTVPSATKKEAVFAGGCFWCVESDFESLPGVIDVISGYTGGHVRDPNYKQVTRGGTGHYEAAKIIYDPSQISYEELLTHYWLSIDPTDGGGQFCDRGPSYQSAIFASPQQKSTARASKADLADSGRLKQKIVTPVLEAGPFYPAESYHQNYYKKNPIRYKYYRKSCGRDKRLKVLWGKDAIKH